MKVRVKKNDSVLVVAGKDRGKQGTVIEVLPKKGKVMVKGVAIVTRHAKARKQGEVAGIKKKETAIDVSNVMPICGSCKKPCRIGSKKLENGRSARTCVRCKEVF